MEKRKLKPNFPEIKSLERLGILESMEMKFDGEYYYPVIKIKDLPELSLEPFTYYIGKLELESRNQYLDLAYKKYNEAVIKYRQGIIPDYPTLNIFSSVPGEKIFREARKPKIRAVLEKFNEDSGMEIFSDDWILSLSQFPSICRLLYVFRLRELERISKAEKPTKADLLASPIWKELGKQGFETALYGSCNRKGLIYVENKDLDLILTVNLKGTITAHSGCYGEISYRKLIAIKPIETLSELDNLVKQIPLAATKEICFRLGSDKNMLLVIKNGLKQSVEEEIITDYDKLLPSIKILSPESKNQLEEGLVDLERMKRLTRAFKILERR